MDSSGTTYFSPPPYITDALNDINLYLYNNRIDKIETNKNVYKWTNNTNSGSEFSDVLVSINFNHRYNLMDAYYF